MKRNTNTNNNGIANTNETSNNKNSINNGNTSEIIDRTLKNQKYTNEEEAITKTILESVPKESQITLARFEGPNIALYTKKPTVFSYRIDILSIISFKNLEKKIHC
jgi:hypothetical protein